MSKLLIGELTLPDNGSEKCLLQESKTTNRLTRSSVVAELCRLPPTSKSIYPRGGLGVHSIAVSAAETSVNRKKVQARLGKRADGGDERGEYGV